MNAASVDLISRLLNKDPSKRIQCKDVKNHIFYNNIDWDKLYKMEIEPPCIPKTDGMENEPIVKPTMKIIIW